MHSLGIVQWNSTRRDHPGNPGRVSGSGPVNTYFSSLLGPSMDLGLDLGLYASLYISFLRISATYYVSWTNRLFGKASPMNGFDVSLLATV